MKDGDHLIWSNIHLNYEDWRPDLEADYPDLTEAELYYKMREINADYLEDERANLNIPLGEPILVVADLGLWHGRVPGYREILSGNIQDCLSHFHDYATWYVDKRGDLRCEDIHHDGTNHYLYRVFKENVDEEQRNDLEYRIYCGKATERDVAKLTNRLGDEIGKVYGWEFPVPQERWHSRTR